VVGGEGELELGLPGLHSISLLLFTRMEARMGVYIPEEVCRAAERVEDHELNDGSPVY